MNVINSTKERLEVAKKKVHSLELQLNGLRVQYQGLLERQEVIVEENITFTNNMEIICDVLSNNCLDCVLRGTRECNDCNFHRVAIDFNLWNFD